MWFYSQRTGALHDASMTLVGSGYAGAVDAKNDPAKQRIKNVGPLPVGLYKMSAAVTHPRLGPIAIYLAPDAGNTMYGRSAFYVHGDSIKAPGTASEGCIIMPRAVRLLVNASKDRWLAVIRESL